jgi:hypothetical protein
MSTVVGLFFVLEVKARLFLDIDANIEDILDDNCVLDESVEARPPPDAYVLQVGLLYGTNEKGTSW